MYLSPRLDAAERDFLRSLAGHVPVAVCLPWLDDPLADPPMRETADALAAALNTSVTACETPSTWPAMRVVSAPDPEEEARSVLRRLLADMEAGVPLWRMAVLYSADELYAPLVREMLDSAGLPWHSALGRPASAGLAARSLLGLLVPVLFERTFGDERDPDTWPAVEVLLADGSVVRFRGAIDRVDISPSRVLVIDYKSGSTWGFDGLETDPVLAGRHLQLVLYARATRGNVPDADDVRAEFRFVSTKGKFERRQIAATAEADERLVEVVQHVADGIRSGVFLPRPGEYDRGTFKNCRFCEYDRICSTSRDLAWERKSPGIALLPLDPRA